MSVMKNSNRLNACATIASQDPVKIVEGGPGHARCRCPNPHCTHVYVRLRRGHFLLAVGGGDLGLKSCCELGAWLWGGVLRKRRCLKAQAYCPRPERLAPRPFFCE